jgi:catechol 2,3-dioxygenase-like lactoylglutathione lyase family enzyme
MTTMINRRRFFVSLPVLLAAPRLLAQETARLKIRGFNHVALGVSDMRRSVDFYQSLFGLPVLAQTDTNTRLRVGPGPQFLALLSPAPAVRIDHFGLGVDDYNADRILAMLRQHGVAKSEQRGPMNVVLEQGRPEMAIGDPDGIIVQLRDATYPPNETAKPAPKPGLIALKGYSHCTVFSTDVQRSNAFYRDVFGMGIRSYQGPAAPTLAVGAGVEFVMFTGGPSTGSGQRGAAGSGRAGSGQAPSTGAGQAGAGGAAAAPRQASINHFCMTLENFKPDEILKTLESYGIKPRESQTGPVGPLRHYISMRMENRGGAKEGTPELYFTDPDGILVQLQDVRYCGGAGVLGNVCPQA